MTLPPPVAECGALNKYEELIECGNLAIADMASKCEAVFASHKKAHVGISGGADSDVMLDLCERVKTVQPIDVTYDFIDTGLEYQATKNHIAWLEDRYRVKIVRTRAVETIPMCVKKYGQPFMSKMVSHHIGILQSHGFKWEDNTLAVLKVKYPDIPESTLKWWCSAYETKHGVMSSYCIGRNRWLKEYVMENPPTFRVSAKCCTRAKKLTKQRVLAEGGFDLDMYGTRRAEGCVRALSGKCFDQGRVDAYRPLFWLTNADREHYDRAFGIRHSDCYGLWGFERTGCVGCPFNKKVQSDLMTVERHEPNMAKAARSIFAESYEYTLGYEEFRREKKSGGQLRMRM